MKTFILSFILAITISTHSFASDCSVISLVQSTKANTNQSPKPEKIYPFTKVLHPVTYYIEQATLWAAEIAKDEQQTTAWLNYYQAARIANIFSTEEKPFDLDTIFRNLEKAIPNTYEHHYITYVQGGGDHDLFSHLEKAYQLNSNRVETYQGMMAYHEIQRNMPEFKSFCKKSYEQEEFSPGILAWNYNALVPLEKNALLITYGDNDTYPLWLLQQAKDMRKDVTIMNINLLQRVTYRAAIFKENNIPSYDLTLEDFDSYEDYLAGISQHLVGNAQQPLYFSIATSRNIRKQFKENLYLIGLALKYSKTPFDNNAVLKENFEQHFLTDHLEINFENDFSASVLNTMNVNYIPAFLRLHEYYLKNKSLTKAEHIKHLSLKIAEAGNRLESIEYFLQKQTARYKPIESILTIKELESGMMAIQSGLWAKDTETTNEHYEQFLMDLLKNKEFDLLEKCKTTKTDWNALLPSKHQGVKDEIVFNNGHPDAPTSPIQNISYEAAEIYCLWISNVYNNTLAKKKQFQEVQFRLPTEAEWEMAARAGRKDAVYPWGGHFVKNVKGCYLSNFYVSEEAPCVDCKYPQLSNDGAFFPVTATAYFPNDFGLYGLTGNVAEMVAEKGLAKGGSWEDKPEDCKIQSQKQYDSNSPAIGFRVFMDVIN